MGKAAWVCFECREAVRRNTRHRGDVPCPRCGRPCRYLGYKIPVPPKREVKVWADLREQLDHEQRQRQQQALVTSVRGRHRLEQEIAKLEAMPQNPGRKAAIQKLRKQLERTERAPG